MNRLTFLVTTILAAALLGGCSSPAPQSSTATAGDTAATTTAGDTAATTTGGGSSAGTAERRRTADYDAFDPALRSYFDVFVATGGLEVEHFSQLPAAVRESSAVVVGQVVDVFATRAMGEPDDMVQYSGMAVDVVEVLAGSLPPEHQGRVVVEFMGDQAEVDALRADLPEGYAIWLLHRKGDPIRGGQTLPAKPEERDFYRLVSSQGLFVQGREHVRNPVIDKMRAAESRQAVAPGRSASADVPADPVAAEAQRYRKLSDLADAIRRMR